MLPRILLERIDRSGSPILRRALASGCSVAYTLARRSRHRYLADPDGFWIGEAGGTTTVSPHVRTTSAAEVRDLVRFSWCHAYLPGPGDIVVDVGAGIGEEAIEFSRMVGTRGRVIAIEAHPRTFECLSRTVRANHATNVTCIHAAATDHEGTVYIEDSATDIANSIIRSGGTPVPGRMLSNLLAGADVSHIDLLKMNIEGAEHAALEGMGAALDHVRNACVSCHDFIANRGGEESMRTRERVKALLGARGFSMHRHSTPSAPWVADYVYASRGAPER